MKKILLGAFLFPIILLLNSFNYQETVSINFENGNRAIDQANCWGFNGITYSNSPNHVLANNWSGTSNYNSTCLIKSPLLKIGDGTINLKTKLLFSNDLTILKKNYGFSVKFIPFNKNGMPTGVNIDTISYKFEYPYTIAQNVIINVPKELNNTLCKVLIRFIGELDKVNIIVDDLSIPGVYFANPSENCNPLNGN